MMSTTIRMARKACGLAMMLAAMSGVALAVDPPPAGAPELDPGSMAAAFGLLSGGLLMLIDRRRKPAR